MLAAVTLGLGACAPATTTVLPRHLEPPARARLELGPTWSCVAPPPEHRARAGGRLACWGAHPRTEDWWATTHEKLDRLGLRGELRGFHIGSTGACVLDGINELTCWSGEPSCVLQSPGTCGHGPRWRELPVLTEVERFVATDEHVCAALASGTVVCAALESEHWHRIRGVSSPVDELVVGIGGTGCAAQGSAVACWGLLPSTHERSRRKRVSIRSREPSPYQPRRGPRARPVERDPWSAYACKTTGVCAPERRAAIDVLASLPEVELGPTHGCGLDDRGRVWCAWYGTAAGSIEPAALVGQGEGVVERGHAYEVADLVASAVVVAEGHACTLTSDFEVHCWGRDEHCQAQVPALFRAGHSGDPCERVEVTRTATGSRTIVDWSEAEQRFMLSAHDARLMSKGQVMNPIPGGGTGYQLRCVPGPARVPRGCPDRSEDVAHADEAGAGGARARTRRT